MVMNQKDYLLRQIEITAKVIARMLGLDAEYLPLEGVVWEQSYLPADANLRNALHVLIGERKINEAEDLLFEHIEAEAKKEYLAIALEFYETLAGIDLYELEMMNFSRQEVLDGLNEVKRIYEQKEA